MDEIVDQCRQIIERGSKSFAGAARLLDHETRASVYMLYAWCRYCDDVIDDQDLGFRQTKTVSNKESLNRELALLEKKTIEAYQGSPDQPVFQALSHVVKKHDIPMHHPLELLEGFRMDATARQYRTLEDTLSYSYHVAGVVGVMMAMIMGVRDRNTLERAQDLGIAFQLTNISRDVIDDFEMRRIYLPADWLLEEGVDPSEVGEPEKRVRVFRVVDRLLDVAEKYYHSAGYGLADLPWSSAWGIAAARAVYRDIGTVVRSQGANAWDERAVVSKARKISCLGKGFVHAIASRANVLTGPAPERAADLWTYQGFRNHNLPD